LELRIFVDDASGKTVREERVPVQRSSTIASNAVVEIPFWARYSVLPDGLYTIKFELFDRASPTGAKFLAGATKTVELKTTTAQR
jgi:hypothetical protein